MSHTCFFIAQLGEWEGEERWNGRGRGEEAEGRLLRRQSRVGVFLVQFLSIPVFREFSWSPADNKIGCRGGTPSLPKSPSLRHPPGRKSHRDVSEVGVSRMAQTVPPFGGEKEGGGGGEGLWVVVGVTGGSVGAGRGEGVCGGAGIRRGEGVCVRGGGPLLKIKTDEWLHFREEYHAAPLLCKSHVSLAYKYCNPPSSNWTKHCRF